MEVIAFFLLFAVTNYAVAGGNKKSGQPAKESDQSAVETQSAEPSASDIFADLGRKAVTKLHTIGMEPSSDSGESEFPSELTESRSWDEFETPSYRRR